MHLVWTMGVDGVAFANGEDAVAWIGGFAFVMGLLLGFGLKPKA